MKALTATLAGMFLGGLFLTPHSGFTGVLLGGGFGYALHAISRLRSKVDSLQRDLERLLEQRKEEAAAPGPRKEAPARPTAPPFPAAPYIEEPERLQPQQRAEDLAAKAPRQTAEGVTSEPRSRPQQAAHGTETGAGWRPQQTAERSKPAAAGTAEFPEWMGRLLSGENLLVKLGIIILFFGVSFLVTYAAQHGMFPLQLRLIAAALGGCGLLAIGWRLRGKRAVYAQVLQGGGVGILYLTTFAAMRLYHFIPTAAGLFIMTVICTVTALLAVWQDAAPMALFGTAGAFLAPELAAIGSGNHVTLFLYYALLDAGIFAIAWFRAWRQLNVLGFVCTFIVSALWGERFYQPWFFDTVEPFLILFFVCYTAIPILFARRAQSGGVGYLDGTLVFGTPIAAFALQASLVRGYDYGLAWSAAALALFYLALSRVLLRFSPTALRPFREVFLSFGVVFATLTVPLACDARWTAAAWSVEGAGLVWAGVRQERRLARCFGYLLLIASGAAFLYDTTVPTGPWAVLNGYYTGSLMISGSALYAAWLLFSRAQRVEEWETLVEKVLFGWGGAWWFFSGLNEIAVHTDSRYADGASLAFIALSCGAAFLLRPRLRWPLLDVTALGLLPAMWLFAGYLVMTGADHPALHGGYIAWPLAFAVWYRILTGDEASRPIFHAAALWLLALLMAWEAHWGICHEDARLATWAATAWGLVPAAVAVLIARWGERLTSLVSDNYDSYLWWGSGPLAVWAWIWTVTANLTLPGDPWPLSYVPVFNPVDAATILALGSVAVWSRKVERDFPALVLTVPRLESRIIYGGSIFLCLNAALLRTIHHWCGIPFTASALLGSMLVQTAFSIFWSVTALGAMTMAARRGMRPLWIAGAILLGTVVVKLFLVDLANSGSVERIVSFVGVGLLLLVIGWFAPAPPRAQKKSSS